MFHAIREMMSGSMIIPYLIKYGYPIPSILVSILDAAIILICAIGWVISFFVWPDIVQSIFFGCFVFGIIFRLLYTFTLRHNPDLDNKDIFDAMGIIIHEITEEDDINDKDSFISKMYNDIEKMFSEYDGKSITGYESMMDLFTDSICDLNIKHDSTKMELLNGIYECYYRFNAKEIKNYLVSTGTKILSNKDQYSKQNISDILFVWYDTKGLCQAIGSIYTNRAIKLSEGTEQGKTIENVLLQFGIKVNMEEKENDDQGVV